MNVHGQARVFLLTAAIAGAITFVPSRVLAQHASSPSASPPPAERPEVEKKRYSMPMFVTGIVTASLGAATALTGLAMSASADSTEQSCNSASETVVETGGDPLDCNRQSTRDAGVATMIVGVGLAAVGLPLAIIGGRKVPARDARVWVAPTAGGARAGVGVRF